MKLNVARELRQPGRIGRHSFDMKLGVQEYLGSKLCFTTPLGVEVECVYDGEGFSVRGEAKAAMDSRCALCEKPFSEDVAFSFDERFVVSPEEDSECYAYKGEELDLQKMLMDNLFLNLPVFSRCSEDCRGLCPVCGMDLNRGQCSCRREADKPESPFAALGQLLDHDKEV